MQGADIVQHVLAGERDAEQSNEKIEAEEHLQHATDAVVAADPEEAEVSEAGHPHVRGDQHTNKVVHLYDRESHTSIHSLHTHTAHHITSQHSTAQLTLMSTYMTQE